MFQFQKLEYFFTDGLMENKLFIAEINVNCIMSIRTPCTPKILPISKLVFIVHNFVRKRVTVNLKNIWNMLKRVSTHMEHRYLHRATLHRRRGSLPTFHRVSVYHKYFNTCQIIAHETSSQYSLLFNII